MRGAPRGRLPANAITHRSFGRRQSPLPADVYEARRDDDHADGADDHKNHEQLAVVAACLTGARLTSAGCAVVLDAHLNTDPSNRLTCVTNISRG